MSPRRWVGPLRGEILPLVHRRAIVHSTIGCADAAPLFRTIVRLPSFERSARGILGAEEEAWLDDTLARLPELGAVIRGTGGVRKIRVALPGRGKSGGHESSTVITAGPNESFSFSSIPRTGRKI